MEYEIHPACAVIPLPPDEEINELAQSIKLNGLREPITLTQDQLLLDGRCRVKACLIAGVEVRTEIYTGDNPVLFVLDKNINRRHLTKLQRQFAIAELTNLQHGTNQYQCKGKGRITLRERSTFLSVEDASKKYGVPKGTLARTRTIIDHAAPHVREMVTTDKVTPYVAAEAVRNVSKAVQANWTVEDVKREGQKRINNQLGKREKAAQPKVRKAPVDPYASLGLKRLADINPGPHGSRGDQRVFLVAPHIQDLRDLSVMLAGDMFGPVISFRPASQKDWTCTPEVIGDALKRLLTYKPVLGRYNGEEIDFATKLRKELKEIDGMIRKGIDWLTGVEAAITDAVQIGAQTLTDTTPAPANQMEK